MSCKDLLCRTKREGLILQTVNNPAPCQYNVQDKLLYQTTCPHKSVFNSKSKRDDMFPTSTQVSDTILSYNSYNTTKNAFISILQGPGPADYSPAFEGSISQPSAPKPLPYYHQKHYLCISAPAIPLPPLPPSPGPGHYETQDQMTIVDNGACVCIYVHRFHHAQRYMPFHSTDKKSLVSGAVFKSTTSRWMSTNTINSTAPGPCSYDPMFPKKRSYLYNVERKWI